TLADLVNRKDVGMIETRGRFGFATETLESFARIRMIGQDALEGDNAPGMALPCTINHTHPAARDLLQDFIVSEAPFSVANIDLREELIEAYFILVDRFIRAETPREQTVHAEPMTDR